MKFNSIREVIEHFAWHGIKLKRTFKPSAFGSAIGNEIVYPDPNGGYWIEWFKDLTKEYAK